MRTPFASAPERDLAEALRRRAEELGDELPRVGLYLFDARDPAALRTFIDRIPKPVEAWLEEVVVVVGPGERGAPPGGEDLASGRPFALHFHRRPRDDGWGGARKAAFEHALARGFDYLITLRPGIHPPDALLPLVHAALVEGREPVLGSRFLDRRAAWRGGLPLVRVIAHGLATRVQNRVLGLRQRDYHSSLRLYPTRGLAAVPFQLGSDDRAFDFELLIQLRALGIAPHEVRAGTWRETPEGPHQLRHVALALRTALAYRLHQLHVTRDGRFLVDHGVHYTLKQSETSSHMQIVDAIRSGSRVLDLGCSQGLLARPLRSKGVRVTGVDASPARRLADELETYHRRDLEAPLELPEGRVFDYVVVADVLEHLRERQQLLRRARRFLKEDGRLIASTPNIALWFYRLSLLVGRFEYGPRGVLDRTHVHLYTRASFRRELERAGYRIVRQRVTALPFEVVFESTGRSRLVRGLASAYHALARAWPKLFAYQFVLEAEIATLDEGATPAATSS